jgi:hypothetical protein
VTAFERNPVTHARHRREVFWQITFPLLLGVVLCLALSFLIAVTPATGARQWANISLVWLILIGLLFSLILTLILAACVGLILFLLNKLPILFYKLYGWTLILGAHLDQIGSRLVEPILRVHSFRASLRAFSRSMRRQ